MKKQEEHAGSRLRKLRAVQGLTQEALAEKIGKTRSLISYFERTGNMNKYVITDIAEALGIDPALLEDNGTGHSIEDQLHPTGPKQIPLQVLIEQHQEEVRFLKDTINHQWQLLHELSKRKWGGVWGMRFGVWETATCISHTPHLS